jgi:hypothetical protein
VVVLIWEAAIVQGRYVYAQLQNPPTCPGNDVSEVVAWRQQVPLVHSTTLSLTQSFPGQKTPICNGILLLL